MLLIYIILLCKKYDNKKLNKYLNELWRLIKKFAHVMKVFLKSIIVVILCNYYFIIQELINKIINFMY